MTPQAPMTARELQAWLRARFPKEDERHEWKEWRSLKQNISGRKGEDLASYISALANMDGGCIVIGVQDRTLAVTGIQEFADYTVENVVHRVLGRTPGLPSMGLRVQELRASDTGAVVWLVHVPRHAPRELVFAHDQAWQRDGDSLTGLREDRRRAILLEPLAGEDWSAVLVPGATLEDLDPAAIAKAREKYFEKHQRQPWAAQVPLWDAAKLLDKVGLTVHGQVTRACLLLLGLPERATALLSPHPVEITWKVAAERVAELFHPPFLLTTTHVAQHIRNPNIKLFPANELLAVTLPRYDTNTVLLEGLHNCLAHQDYAQCGRIVVEESAGLVEGRISNLFVSAHVANATDTRTVYTRNKGLDDHYYKTLVLQHLRDFKTAPASELRELLMKKLPDALTAAQKESKVKNLLTALRTRGLNGQKIVAQRKGNQAYWALERPSGLG